MLKPAQLFIGELKQKSMETYYDPRYMYYSPSTGNSILDVPEDNTYIHSFVSIDKDGKLVGFIQYNINWQVKSVYNLGVMSFDIGNLEFIKDLYQAIDNIFTVHNLNRLYFWAIADNPVLGTYKKLVEKYGGRQCGYTRQSCILQDGKLHDEVQFEIMRDEYFSKKL